MEFSEKVMHVSLDPKWRIDLVHGGIGRVLRIMHPFHGEIAFTLPDESAKELVDALIKSGIVP